MAIMGHGRDLDLDSKFFVRSTHEHIATLKWTSKNVVNTLLWVAMEAKCL